MRDDPNHLAWVATRNAPDLVSGKTLGKSHGEIVRDPVIRIALDHAGRFVNHNNALVQAEDKAYLARTLKKLAHGGHAFDVDEVCAYAATGWTGRETERIKEYGRRVLEGRTFRLESGIGPVTGECKRWDAEATDTKWTSLGHVARLLSISDCYRKPTSRSRVSATNRYPRSVLRKHEP